MDPPVEAVKRLLFVHQGALGDFIVTFPALRLLRTGFTRIDGICRATFGRLAEHLGIIDTYYSQDAARFASLYSTVMDARVADLLQAYDRIVLFSFSETLEKSVRRIASGAVHRIAPWPREEQGIHAAAFLLRRLAEEGLLPEAESTSHPAVESPQNPAACPGKPRTGTRIILCPGAGSRSKRWPLVGYLQLADMLTKSGFDPQWILGPAERDLEWAFAAGSAAGRTVHRPQDLVRLAELLQSVDGYVGNDSAVSHLASYLEIPVVVIFGPSNPDHWRPFGSCVTVLRAEAPPGATADEANTGGSDRSWLEQISPATVLASVRGLVQP